MPRWVEFTLAQQTGDEKVHVNVELAATIRRGPSRQGTTIGFQNDSTVMVRESVNEVLQKIHED